MARILIHDFGGYCFPFELARYWAARGHAVRCRYFVDVGCARGNPSAAAGLDVAPVEAGGYRKYSFLTKPWQDRRYGRLVAGDIAAGGYDLVISSDTPLDAQAVIQAAARHSGARFVYWLQDLISAGIGVALEARGVPSAAARLVRAAYGRKEARMLRCSDAVVLAAPVFQGALERAGVAAGRSTLIENWCPLSDIPPRPRNNDWTRKQGLVGRHVVLYAGTLGLKHNPQLIVDLATGVPEALFVIVGEGPGVDAIRTACAVRSIGNVRLLPLQPYAELPDVLAAATLLLALGDGKAARFCYPSKILTYFCAGRPVLGVLEPGSYAARLLGVADAGLVVDPAEPSADALRRLLADEAECRRMGQNGRGYAERRFDMRMIGPQFDALLARCLRLPIARSAESC